MSHLNHFGVSYYAHKSENYTTMSMSQPKPDHRLDRTLEAPENPL